MFVTRGIADCLRFVSPANEERIDGQRGEGDGDGGEQLGRGLDERNHEDVHRGDHIRQRNKHVKLY